MAANAALKKKEKLNEYYSEYIKGRLKLLFYVM